MSKLANFSFSTHTVSFLIDTYYNHCKEDLEGVFKVALGVFSIGVFAKNMGDPYYEPTIVVHDTTKINILKVYSHILRHPS